jgi:hypothetical protein
MTKSRPSFAPVSETGKPDLNIPGAPWQRWLVRFLGCVVVVYLVWLGVVEALRLPFPWDLFVWPESPFMTNMLKLDLGQPLFGPPADANSFVYSPGLEYLTFALLKPLGLHLDIRYCRLVNVAIGVLAGIVAGLALGRAIRFVAPENRLGKFAWLGGGVAGLVIFRNFTADVTHPDNLVMLHTAGVFLLTFWAWREKRFGVAVLAMVLAGCGVFAKQILALAFLGPALVFAWFNPFGRRRGLLLALVGAFSAFGSLGVISSSAEARFYLLQLLPHQGIHVTRFYWMMIDLVTADRAFLLVLGLSTAGLLWRSGAAGREYLQFCAAIGIFSVCPNVASYVKTMGIWNNLIIFQLWLILITWPALALWLSRGADAKSPRREETSLFTWTVASVLVVFVLLLFPPKTPAQPAMYAACELIQKQVDADVKARRKVLVGHGMMYLLRAGSREVPLDRVNSILELKAAGYEHLTKFPERIRQHYYDRLYLTVETWYPSEFVALIDQHYQVESIVPRPSASDHIETGRYLALISECRILVPREPSKTNAPIHAPAQ